MLGSVKSGGPLRTGGFVVAAIITMSLATAPFAATVDAASPVYKTQQEACPANKLFAYKVDGGWKSGGCTCYLAGKVSIPWTGDAGKWWSNAGDWKWSRDAHQPKAYSIAAYATHVAWVDSVTKTGEKRETTRTESVKVGTRTETTTTYRDEWRWERGKRVKVRVPVVAKKEVPIYKTVLTERVTETHQVNASQMDFDKTGIRNSNWTAMYTYTVRDGVRSASSWNTPKTGGANGLIGYIYTR